MEPPTLPSTFLQQIGTAAFWGFFGLLFTYCVWSLKRIVKTLDDIEDRVSCHDKKLAKMDSHPANIDELYGKISALDTTLSALRGEHKTMMSMGGCHTHRRETDSED